MIILIMFFSFVFEFLFNSLFYNSLFLPLCVLISLILLEPFYRNKDKYLIFSFIVGFLYDIVFTGDIFLNSSLFLLIGGVIVIINRATPNNLFITFFEIIIFIFLYRFFCFLFFGLMGVVSINFSGLFNCICSSFIFNIIYGIVLYFILFFLSLKFNIRRIN